MSVVTRPGESGLGTETEGFAIAVDGLRKLLATRLFKWEVV
jgi:hypothetical protein